MTTHTPRRYWDIYHNGGEHVTLAPINSITTLEQARQELQLADEVEWTYRTQGDPRSRRQRGIVGAMAARQQRLAELAETYEEKR